MKLTKLPPPTFSSVATVIRSSEPGVSTRSKVNPLPPALDPPDGRKEGSRPPSLVAGRTARGGVAIAEAAAPRWLRACIDEGILLLEEARYARDYTKRRMARCR